jgi:hypothetical protein
MKPPDDRSLRNDEITGGPGLSDRDAQLADALLKEIRRDLGHLNSKELHTEMIARSRPADSPTHHLFEWDAQKAHAKYLYERARQIVMKVRIVFAVAPTEPMRAHPVLVTRGRRGPVPMREVVRSPDLMKALLEEALVELERWRRRYQQLERLGRLQGVFTAIKRVTKKKK